MKQMIDAINGFTGEIEEIKERLNNGTATFEDKYKFIVYTPATERIHISKNKQTEVFYSNNGSDEAVFVFNHKNNQMRRMKRSELPEEHWEDFLEYLKSF